jgi:hypothetical protein
MLLLSKAIRHPIIKEPVPENKNRLSHKSPNSEKQLP